MFDYFREAVERKAKGNTLLAFLDTKRRRVGWVDVTEGFQLEAGLWSHIKTQFSDLGPDIKTKSMTVWHSQESRDENMRCRTADWKSIGLTWESAREIIRTSERRGEFFGQGSEEERAEA